MSSLIIDKLSVMSPAKVAFYTEYPYFFGGRLFDGHRRPGSYPSQPFRALKKILESRGWIVLTYDQIHKKSSLDVIIFLDLPKSPREVRSVRSACPKATLILYILESPAHHPGQFSVRNYDCFDYVITYNKSLEDNRKIFYCPIPFDDLSDDDLSWITPWNKRRVLTVVSGRKKAGFFVDSGSGYLHRFGVRGLGEPWHTPFPRLLTQWNGYQYDLRNKLVHELDVCLGFSSIFDVYGNGWNGEPIGYWERFVKGPPSIAASKGAYNGDKLKLLSGYRYTLVIENWIGSECYLSEKLFEALSAGCIPIYWGDRSVSSLLPDEVFINGSRFCSARDIINFLHRETREEWSKRLSAINHFKNSQIYKTRSPEGFAKKFVVILNNILNPESSK